MSVRILHVINDVSFEMRYGGPAMNCLRHSKFLESEDTQVTVWGTYSSSPLPYGGSFRIFRKNRVYLSRYRFTFQFHISNVRSLFNAINSADLVHVHFAREMNPVLASLITILLRKKLVLQTHGMIVKNQGFFYKLWDSVFTNWIFSKSSVVLPLQKMEELDLRDFPIKRFHIVPNGIEVSDSFKCVENREGIVFISRIHERKRPGVFLDAATMIRSGGYSGGFSIYGEDAGYLPQLVDRLKRDEASGWYKGGVSQVRAVEILSSAELLILPSYHEPFPMVVLESLTVGTPVVIMNDCGISDMVAKLDPLFVCSPIPYEISANTLEIISKYRTLESRIELAMKARQLFSLSRTIEGFKAAYAIAGVS